MARDPRLHPAGALLIEIGEVQSVGAVATGQRRISLISGGRAEGALLSGTILPGGSDWQLIRADGVVEIDARFVIRRDSGELLTVRNQGYRHGPPEVMAALGRGEQVPDDAYYFGSVVRIEGTQGPLDRTIILADGIRSGGEVRLSLFAFAAPGGFSPPAG